MIVNNLIGTAANFIPRNVAVKKTKANIDLLTNFSTTGNRIALFTGAMPDINELYEGQLLDTIISNYNDKHVATIDNLGFTYLYDFVKKERTIKITLPNALDFTSKVDGTIGWYAIKLTEATGEAVVGEEVLIFSDSIGLWEDTSRSIVVDQLDVTIGSTNIFKSFLLSFKDSITSELV